MWDFGFSYDVTVALTEKVYVNERKKGGKKVSDKEVKSGISLSQTSEWDKDW